MANDKNIDIDRLSKLLRRFDELEIGKQIDYEKFYLYSIITDDESISIDKMTTN